MPSDNLMSASAFAKLCNVTTQTVLNWVQNGTLKPASIAGGKSFFSVDQYAKMQIDELKRRGTKSFLGVVFGKDEADLETQVVRFVDAIKESAPKAVRIDDLHKYYMDMIESGTPELSEDMMKLFKHKLVLTLCAEVRSSVLSYVMEVYANVSDTSDFPLRFFLNVMFGDEPDENHVEVYKELNIDNSRYMLEGMKRTADIMYSGLLEKYGVLQLLSSFPLREAYYENTGMVDFNLLEVNLSSTGAKQLYENVTRKASKDAKSLALGQVYANGFFSVTARVGTLTSKDEVDLLVRIADQCYSVFFCNNFDVLPDSMKSLIQMYENQGVLRVLSV